MGDFLVRRDVGSVLNIEFSESSQPSTAEVESFIDDIEAEVKGSINVARLAIPTSALNPVSYKIVRNIILDGVCARTQAAYGGNVMGLSPREDLFWGRFLDGKIKIEQSPRYLPDATDLTSDSDTDIRSAFLEDSGINYDPIHAMDDEY